MEFLLPFSLLISLPAGDYDCFMVSFGIFVLLRRSAFELAGASKGYGVLFLEAGPTSFFSRQGAPRVWHPFPLFVASVLALIG